MLLIYSIYHWVVSWPAWACCPSIHTCTQTHNSQSWPRHCCLRNNIGAEFANGNRTRPIFYCQWLPEQYLWRAHRVWSALPFEFFGVYWGWFGQVQQILKDDCSICPKRIEQRASHPFSKLLRIALSRKWQKQLRLLGLPKRLSTCLCSSSGNLSKITLWCF